MNIHNRKTYGSLFGRLLAGMMTVTALSGLFPLCTSAAPGNVTGEKNIVVVIDPGHGGSNIGGQIPGIDENIGKYKGEALWIRSYLQQETSIRWQRSG